MDILRGSQLVIFSHSTIFMTFSYKSLAVFLFKLSQSAGSGVGFLCLTAVCARTNTAKKQTQDAKGSQDKTFSNHFVVKDLPL